MSTTRYQISTTDGRQHPALRETYADQDDAAEALRKVLGWDAIVLSDSYQATDSAEAVSCYQTQAECDADADGAHAPRITEMRACHGCGEYTTSAVHRGGEWYCEGCDRTPADD